MKRETNGREFCGPSQKLEKLKKIWKILYSKLGRNQNSFVGETGFDPICFGLDDLVVMSGFVTRLSNFT